LPFPEATGLSSLVEPEPESEISQEWFDDGELSEQEKAKIEARLDEYDRNPEAGSSWEEAKARVLAGLHGK